MSIASVRCAEEKFTRKEHKRKRKEEQLENNQKMLSERENINNTKTIEPIREVTEHAAMSIASVRCAEEKFTHKRKEEQPENNRKMLSRLGDILCVYPVDVCTIFFCGAFEASTQTDKENCICSRVCVYHIEEHIFRILSTSADMGG